MEQKSYNLFFESFSVSFVLLFLMHKTPQVMMILSLIKVSYAIKPEQNTTTLHKRTLI